METLLDTGAVRHKQLVRILRSGLGKKLVQAFAQRPGPLGSIQCDNLYSRGSQRVDFRHGGGDVHIRMVLIDLLDNADDGQIYILADLQNVLHRIGTDTGGTAPGGSQRHPAHDKGAVQGLLRQGLAGDDELSANFFPKLFNIHSIFSLLSTTPHGPRAVGRKPFLHR